ncbi:cytochrome P450 [Aspergillus desertorum]
MVSTFLTCLVGLLSTYIFLGILLVFTQDSQEPPPVDCFIPFVTPILRMSRAGFGYYKIHRRLPVYTLRLPGVRLYVVNSAPLISAVQHHPRTLSFSPILALTAANLIGASKPGVAVLSDDAENGFIKRFHDFNHAKLGPGLGLDSLRARFWSLASSSLAHGSAYSRPRSVRMYEWVAQEVMINAADALYGGRNPFRDPATRATWRIYQSGMTRLVTGFMQSIVARQSLRAREALVKSFERYYNRQEFSHEEASPYIKAQYQIFSENGLSDADIAKTSTAFSIALMGNTIPATFWLLYHIFASDTVLQDCRKELSAVLQKTGRDGGRRSLDLMLVEESCPRLLSTFKESMRMHSMGTAVTKVMEDQMLDNKYLLKKGAYVLIPAGIQHTDQSLWGKDANEFNHLRFVGESMNDKRRSRDPPGYRPFGGGWTLCPGRHIATSMVLGFAAAAIMSFDMQTRSGQWITPTIKNSNLGVGIGQPDEDLVVELRRRNEEEWAAVYRA